MKTARKISLVRIIQYEEKQWEQEKGMLQGERSVKKNVTDILDSEPILTKS